MLNANKLCLDLVSKATDVTVAIFLLGTINYVRSLELSRPRNILMTAGIASNTPRSSSGQRLSRVRLEVVFRCPNTVPNRNSSGFERGSMPSFSRLIVASRVVLTLYSLMMWHDGPSNHTQY